MLKQDLGQRAVLEALEAKIGALRANNELVPNTILELYFWDDLAKVHPSIFSAALPLDIAEALTAIEKQSVGLFKIESLEPSVSSRDILRVPHLDKDGRIVDISNLHWRIRYNTKLMPNLEDQFEARLLWLTPRELYAHIDGKKRSLTFEPHGKQYRILECLSEHDDYIETSMIAQRAETTMRNVASQIKQLKTKAESAFGIEENNFIQSSRGEGYALGPTIRINIEK